MNPIISPTKSPSTKKILLILMMKNTPTLKIWVSDCLCFIPIPLLSALFCFEIEYFVFVERITTSYKANFSAFLRRKLMTQCIHSSVILVRFMQLLVAQHTLH